MSLQLILICCLCLHHRFPDLIKLHCLRKDGPLTASNAIFTWGSLVTSIIKFQLILSTRLQLLMFVFIATVFWFSQPLRTKFPAVISSGTVFQKKLKERKQSLPYNNFPKEKIYTRLKKIYKSESTPEETSMLHFVRARLLTRMFILCVYIFIPVALTTVGDQSGKPSGHRFPAQ